MARLEIPDELVNPFIDYVFCPGNIALAEEEQVIALTKKFALSIFDLLPCPFLKIIEMEHTVDVIDNGGEYFVECTCGASGQLRVVFTEAIEYWNRRSDTGICPWCGSDEYSEGSSGDNQYICSDCDSYGPKASTLKEARGGYGKNGQTSLGPSVV